MATINDLIKASYRKLNVIGVSEELSSDQLSEGLDIVNRMVDVWNTEKLVPYYVVREDFTLVSGTQSYTIGSGGVFNTTRPIEILNATITESGSTYPMKIISYGEWMDIFTKADSSNIPSWLYYETNHPLGTIYLYGKPSAANTLTIASYKQIGDFSLGDSISLPSGFEKAIVDNLAVELLPLYPSESLFPLLDRQAKSSIDQIRRVNVQNLMTPMEIDYRAFAGNQSRGYFWGNG